MKGTFDSTKVKRGAKEYN